MVMIYQVKTRTEKLEDLDVVKSAVSTIDVRRNRGPGGSIEGCHERRIRRHSR